MTVHTLYQYVETAVKRKAQLLRLRQTPSIHERAGGELMLGDFRAPLVPQALTTATFAGAAGIVFSDRKSERTKAILTNWSDRSKTVEQLQYAANLSEPMEAYTKESFGEWRVALRKSFQFDRTEIEVDGGTLQFPGGRLVYRYEADTKDQGAIVRDLRLDTSWFADLTRFLPLLELFQMRPRAFRVKLHREVQPLDCASALETAGWEIESEAEDTVIANTERIEITVSPRRLEFSGIDVRALFDKDVESTAQHQIIAETIATLAR